LTYDDQVAILIETDKRWEDPTMPRSDALNWDDVLTGSGMNLASYATSSSLKWYRVSDLFSAKRGYSLFGDDNACTLNDIK